MAYQLSDDFSETREDFESMGIPQAPEWQDDEDYDREAWSHGRYVERDGDVALSHEAEEFPSRERQRKQRERRSMFSKGIAAAERWEAEHRDVQAIHGLRAVGGRIRRFSESAASKRSVIRRTVDGLPVGESARPCPFVSGSVYPRGSDPSNTDPSSLQGAKVANSVPVVSPHLGGLDWLGLTIYGEAEERCVKLCTTLLQQRDTMRQGTENEEIAYVGRYVGVLRRQGRGGGFNHMPVVWVSKGITFAFGADRRKHDGTVSKLPQMFIEIPGSACLIQGEIECLEYVAQVLDALGLDATKIRVRRFDVCLDMVGEYRERWKEIINRMAWVTKGGDVKPNITGGGVFTGFSVSGGACSLTVYDKVREVKKKKPEVWPAMVEHRWHGQDPDEAWRVEFRIRPCKSQSLEFRSLTDVLSSLKTICDWACINWFRVVKKRCKNHSERTVMDDLWLEVIAGFGAWAEGQSPLNRRVKTVGDPTRLVKVALGCLAKGLAVAGVELSIEGFDDALTELFAVSRFGGGRRGSESVTQAEKRQLFVEVLAETQLKQVRIWSALPGA